jgi:UDP-N-acetylglucosamine acyltransferase
VIASCALVAGYVEVGDGAFLSGGVVVHQFSKIGRYVMVGGNTRVNSDLPPFFLYTGFNVVPKGLNIVGLRRAGFTRDQMRLLKEIYRVLYRSGRKLKDALQYMESAFRDPLAEEMIHFIRSSNRGIVRERKEPGIGVDE